MRASMASRADAKLHRPAIDQDFAGVRLVDAEQHARDLGPPAADQAAKPEHLSGVELEVDIRKAAGARKAPGLQHKRANRVAAFGIEVGDFAANHHADSCRTAEFRLGFHADETTVAQHRDAVGNAEDLVHAMADEHHRHAVQPEIGDDGEKPLDLALRQGGRGLVHDQHTRVERQRAGDLDKLLFGRAQRSESRFGRHVEADCRQHLARAGKHGGVVDAAKAVARHVAEIDVFRDRKIREQAGMLVHDRDAGGLGVVRRMERHRLAVDLDMTVGGRMTPASSFTQVLLPAPFSPSSASTSPERNSKDASLRAIVPPKAFVA